MDCKTAGRALSAMADGELEPGRIAALEEHVARCRACARSARAFEAVSAWFAAEPRPDAPAGIREKVLERIRRPEARLLALTPTLRIATAAAVILLLGSSVIAFLARPEPPPAREGFGEGFYTAEQVMDQIGEEFVTREINR